MTTSPGKWGGFGLILGTCILIAALPALSAQQVPISFNDFHGHTGAVDYLKKVATAHANIAELIEIGRSTTTALSMFL